LNSGIKIMQTLFKNRLEKSTRGILSQSDMFVAHRNEVKAVLQKLSENQEHLFELGKTEWGFPLILPFSKFIAHSLVTGSTGSGKSYVSLLLLNQMLHHLNSGGNTSMGFLDPKGELAQKAIQYIQAYAYGLEENEREKFLEKVVIIDFSNTELITPYNILHCSDQPKELLINNRLETISQIYQGSTALTARMKSTLKYCLSLLVENELPITFFEKVFFDNSLYKRLANKSSDQRLKYYFLKRFDQELKSTIYALRQRIDGLFVSQGVRLSLSGKTAPDFRKLQDEGCIIIINLAGPNISRATTEFLLHIILSDIKQSVFQRVKPEKSFLWHIDEAQTLFKTHSSKENMNDLLTMSRSFGSFFTLLCQSLSSSVRDKDILNSILANVRWLLTLRSTPRDAQVISSAIPVYGNISNNRHSPHSRSNTLTHEQELKIRLSEISHFAERTGYIWLKSELTKAVKIKTKELLLPHQIAGCNQKQFKDFSESLSISNHVSKALLIKQLNKMEEDLDIDNQDEDDLEGKTIVSTSKDLMQVLEHSYLRKQGQGENKPNEKK